MKAIELLRSYEFRDSHGHPLENCVPFQQLCSSLDALVAKSPLVDRYGTDDEICRHCGASSGIFDDPLEHEEWCLWNAAARLLDVPQAPQEDGA